MTSSSASSTPSFSARRPNLGAAFLEQFGMFAFETLLFFAQGAQAGTVVVGFLHGVTSQLRRVGLSGTRFCASHGSAPFVLFQALRFSAARHMASVSSPNPV